MTAQEPPPHWDRLQNTFPLDVQRRVLARAEYRCQLCGAEMNRSIVKRFMTWPDPTAPWQYLDASAPRPYDGCLVQVKLFLVAPTDPWTDEATIQVRCTACLVWEWVEAVMAYRNAGGRSSAPKRSKTRQRTR